MTDPFSDTQPPAVHRAGGPSSVACAVITLSDTRTLATDSGGQLVVDLLRAAGYEILERAILSEEPEALRALIRRLTDGGEVDVVLMTGGTGISRRDQTFETIDGLLTKKLPGYGELFRWLSFQEIGPAAMLSRAAGGLVGQTVLLSMPGSPAAVRLAMEKLILPELPHLVQQSRK